MPKKNPRQANKNLLIYTEGKHEEIFLTYLKKYLYKNEVRGCGRQTDIVGGTGGSPQDVLDEAIQKVKFSRTKKSRKVHDDAIVVVDRDEVRSEDKLGVLKKKAKENKIILVIFEPCLEALLLSILEDGKDFSDHTRCGWLKGTFESDYLDEEKRVDAEEYQEHFSLENIEQARKRKDHNSQQLDFLIKAMKNEVDFDNEV